MLEFGNVDDEIQFEIAPGVAFLGDAGGGFIETPSELYHVRGEGFAAFVRGVLPMLQSGATLRAIRAQLEGSSGEREASAALAALIKRGFLLEKGAARREPEPRLAVIARATFLEALPNPKLLASDVDVITVDELDDWVARGGAAPSLVLALSDRSQDPLQFAVNAKSVAAGMPVLYAGLERRGGAWVGPLWQPGLCAPCFACLITRVNVNHPQGKLRDQHHRALRQARRAPAPIPCERSLGLLLFARIASAVVSQRGPSPRKHTFAVEWLQRDRHEVLCSPLFPVPHCPACGERQNDEIVAIDVKGGLSDAIDSRTGILHADAPLEVPNTGSRIHVHMSHTRDLGLLGSAAVASTHAGAGTAPDIAKARAIGEGLERYAASIYDPRKLAFATYEELDGKAVHPDSLELFAPHQYEAEGFRYQPFRPDTRVCWVRGAQCDDGSPIWVPAALVYMPYRPRPEEPRIAPSVSGGLAAGPSWQAAVLAGLCEVVERDATAVSWLCRIPPRRWSPELETYRHSLREAYPETAAVSYRVYDVSLDLPLCVALVLAEIDGVPLVATACRLRPERAVDKAMLEALQSLPSLRHQLELHHDWEPGPSFEGVTSFAHHALLYAKFPALRERAGLWLAGDGIADRELREPRATLAQPLGESASEDLAHALAGLRRSGYSPIAVDLTTLDLRHLGVHVVRVIVPGLVQLSGDHRASFLGRRRLTDVRRRLRLPEPALNAMPHPFA